MDLGTAVKVHNPCPRLYIAVAVVINTTAKNTKSNTKTKKHNTTVKVQEKREIRNFVTRKNLLRINCNASLTKKCV